jgi:4'-phosphopantetheinyl transferase
MGRAMTDELTGRTGWAMPAGIPALLDDDVHVWRAPVGRWSERIDALRAILSCPEQERADRFHFAIDRARSIVGRGLLRLLLARATGKGPRELRFGEVGSGKPVLAGNADDSRLQFNVSHSGDLILIAITIARAVGVDVEQIRLGASARDVARSFAASERDALAGLQPPILEEAFFACWTRKEAYIKARGDGLSLPLDSFEVSLLPGDVARLVATRPDAAEAARWTMRDLDVGPGYRAAVAVEGSGWRLRTWDVPSLPAW